MPYVGGHSAKEANMFRDIRETWQQRKTEAKVLVQHLLWISGHGCALDDTAVKVLPRQCQVLLH